VSDSDSDIEAPKKRKHTAGSGDDSGSDVERKKVARAASDSRSRSASPKEAPVTATQDDIFGDDLSISSEDEPDLKAKKQVIDDDDDGVERYDDEGDGPPKKKGGLDSDSDDEKEKAPPKARAPSKSPPPDIPETRIDVEVPKINTDLGKEIHFVKLPNFLSVESRPFDAETYEDEMDEESTQQDEEGRTRLKLKVENTIRWRQAFDKEGNSIKESNARIVKWSDGSYSLHLGNEIFDVHRQPLQSDFNHLFIRQGTGLQGQAVFRTKLSFRPHSTDSQTHKKMTLSMADRSSKTNQIKVISQVGVDPDANRWQRMKKEEQVLRDAIRNDSKIKRTKEKGASKGVTGNYLEGEGGDSDDDNQAFSIAAIKAKYGKGGNKAAPPKAGGGGGQKGVVRAGPGKPVYSSSDSGSDSDDSGRARGKKKASSGSDSDSGRSAKSKASSKGRSSSSSRSRSGSPASKKSSGSGSD